ncbi:MAG: ribosome-associated translation inhibitor RaiA [Candidatus Aminicenantes bacterium]|jgi:putative sigma-54 modulation protein|nr:ribosome-associated translation inhibitor RaiA [Candidatus Aminicenantes bacterium]
MNIHYTARQTEATPEVRAFCEKRLRALGKLLGSVLEVDLILSVEKYRQRVELNVKGKGPNLILTEETQDMFSSLHRVFDRLESKLKKERAKFREQKRRKGRERKELGAPEEKAETGRRVVRSPFFSLKPMSIEEAAIQFDLKKKEVFVFRERGSEKWAVLFKRKDGNLGLVQPD